MNDKVVKDTSVKGLLKNNIKSVMIGAIALAIGAAYLRHVSLSDLNKQPPKTEQSIPLNGPDYSTVGKSLSLGQKKTSAKVSPLDDAMDKGANLVNQFIGRSPESAQKENTPYTYQDFLAEQQFVLYESLISSKSATIHDYSDTAAHSQSDAVNDSTATLSLGSVIRVVVRSESNSHYLGSVWFGTVINDVYDHTMKHLLIGKGDSVVGNIVAITTDNPRVETRIAITVEKIKRSDGNIVVFQQNASDHDGLGAIGGDVNSHTFKKWGGYLAYALIGNSIALKASTDDGPQSSSDDRLSEITGNVAQSTNNIASEYLSIKPTVSLRTGQTVALLIQDDMQIQPLRSL